MVVLCMDDNCFFAVSVGVCDGFDEQDDLMTVGLLRTLSSLF